MTSVFFAVPAYRGIRCVPFYKSLEATVSACKSRGWKVSLQVLQGCCYVQLARNELVNAFIKSGYENIFFLDDDLGWDCENAIKLMEMDDDVVCGIYPNKTEEERYPVVINTEGIDKNFAPQVRDDGCISALMVPTGFMRIKRNVFIRIMEAYPELTYINVKDDGLTAYRLFDFFPQGIYQDRWWGEDFAFCRLWHGIGGNIWVVPNINFYHYRPDDKEVEDGIKGNYHEFLLRQPGGSKWDGTMPHEYGGNNIEGWMTLKEQRWLYDRAKEMKTVLEIGSFKGRSTHAIVSGKPETVYCVDSWEPMSEIINDTAENAQERYNQFLHNINSLKGNGTNIEVYRMKSIEAASMFPDKSLDMVFIDGSHEYEDVIADIRAWLPKTKKLLCGHDYDFSGVSAAIEDFLGEINRYDTIWYVDL